MGTIYIDNAGFLTPYISNGSKDAIIEKRTANSELHWIKTFGGAGDEEIQAITASPAGTIYIDGSFFILPVSER